MRLTSLLRRTAVLAAAVTLALTGLVATPTPAHAAGTVCSGWTTLQYAPQFWGRSCVSATVGNTTRVWGEMYNGSVNTVVANVFSYANNEGTVRGGCGAYPAGVNPGNYVLCSPSAPFWTASPRYSRSEFYLGFGFGYVGTVYSPWLY
jgi:hypothetical protein